MIRYYVPITMLIISMMFTGCRPIYTYSDEEVRATIQNTRDFLLDTSKESYVFETTVFTRVESPFVYYRTSQRIMTSGDVIHYIFTHVDRNGGLRVMHVEKSGNDPIEDMVLMHFYENGMLYTHDYIQNTKQKRYVGIEELDFLNETESRLLSFGRLLKERYIQSASATTTLDRGIDHIKHTSVHLDMESVNRGNIFDTTYDGFWRFSIATDHTINEFELITTIV